MLNSNSYDCFDNVVLNIFVSLIIDTLQCYISYMELLKC